jgi:hypothetical protein
MNQTNNSTFVVAQAHLLSQAYRQWGSKFTKSLSFVPAPSTFLLGKSLSSDFAFSSLAKAIPRQNNSHSLRTRFTLKIYPSYQVYAQRLLKKKRVYRQSFSKTRKKTSTSMLQRPVLSHFSSSFILPLPRLTSFLNPWKHEVALSRLSQRESTFFLPTQRQRYPLRSVYKTYKLANRYQKTQTFGYRYRKSWIARALQPLTFEQEIMRDFGGRYRLPVRKIRVSARQVKIARYRRRFLRRYIKRSYVVKCLKRSGFENSRLSTLKQKSVSLLTRKRKKVKRYLDPVIKTFNRVPITSRSLRSSRVTSRTLTTPKNATPEERDQVVLNRYNWLCSFRSGYRWRASCIVFEKTRYDTMRHRIRILDILKQTKPKRRRGKNKFRRHRRWYPKPMYRFKKKYRKLWTRRYYRRVRYWMGFPIVRAKWDNLRTRVKKQGIRFKHVLPVAALYRPNRLNINFEKYSYESTNKNSVTAVLKAWNEKPRKKRSFSSTNDNPQKWLNDKTKEYRLLQVRKNYAFKKTVNEYEKKNKKRFPKVARTVLLMRHKMQKFTIKKRSYLDYTTKRDGWWSQKFANDNEQPSTWQQFSREKGLKKNLTLNKTMLVSKLFNLFLRTGAKHDIEKKVLLFRSKNRSWDVLNLYRKLYTPVSMVTRTRTIVKDGQVKRRKGLTPRLDRPQKSFVRARKWVSHAVRSRAHRHWWPRVLAEIVGLQGASRLYSRYMKSVARGATVI